MDCCDKENITPQEHIHSIFTEYSTPSRLLQSFTNLSNTVIQTALSGQSKFIFEILQNADDSFEDPCKPIEIKFILDYDYLMVQHDGKGFDFNDVERICDYASQIQEVKATDLSKTGYKGLGFKSLFNLADCIYIFSNNYSFRFDKTYWSDSENKPWQIIPIWCEFNELPLHEKYGYNHKFVNFILKISDICLVESQMKEVVDHPDLLLYLHHIDKVTINLKGEEYFLERKIKEFGEFNIVNFYNNNRFASTWLLKTFNYFVSKELKSQIQKNSQFIYPDKIKSAEVVSFTFALQTDDRLEQIKKVKGNLYSTLPTQLSLELPYHVNSLFILNLDRTQLHENEWNEFLILCIGYSQLCFLKDLAGENCLKIFVLELLVRDIHHHFTTFNKAYRDGFKEAKSKIAWIPSHQGPLLKLGEGWVDETNFFKTNILDLKEKDPEIYLYLISYDLRNVHCLSIGEAHHFTYVHLFKNFETKYCHRLTSSSWAKFVNYLSENSDCVDYNIKRKFPFLMTKNRLIVAPENSLLEEEGIPIPSFVKLNTVDSAYLPLHNAESIKCWLSTLGATRLKTPIQIMKLSLLKWIDSGNLHLNKNYITNHVDIINYLAQNVSQLTYREIEKLKHGLCILTEINTFQLAQNCYFPSKIFNGKLLQMAPKDSNISSVYNIDVLRNFFIHVGVRNKEPIDILRETIIMWIDYSTIQSKIKKSNYKPIIEYISFNYQSIKFCLTRSEREKLKKMPLLTYAGIFKNAEDCYFRSAIPDIKGLESAIAEDELVLEDVFTDKYEYVHEFFKEIGVSEKLSAIDVVRKTVLKWIHDGTIVSKMIKDNDSKENNYSYIIEYVSFLYPIMKSYLASTEKETLKKIPVLTYAQVFKRAKGCYFKSAIPDTKGLECAIAEDEVVLEDVFTDGKYEYVHNFFKEIGVSEKLSAIDVIRKTVLKWIHDGTIVNKMTKVNDSKENNYKYIIEYISFHYRTMEYNLTPTEKDTLKKLPILTYAQVFKRATDCYFKSDILDTSGLENAIAEDELVREDVFTEKYYVHELFKELGVSKLTHKHVIHKTVLKWIREGIISNKITKDNHCAILEYIYKNWKDFNLKENEIMELKKIPILTENNNLNEANNCYLPFSNFRNGGSKGKIPYLEKLFSLDDFISSSYSKEIIEFFKVIGIPEPEFQNIYEKFCDYLTNSEIVKWFFTELKSYWHKILFSSNKENSFLVCLKNKLKSRKLLAKGGTICYPKDLYCSKFNELNEIDPSIIPVLEYESLPEELEKILGFKQIIEMPCVVQLLNVIENKPELGTLKFFTILLQQLKTKDRCEIKKYQLSLLSEDNEIRLAKDLYYFKEENAVCVKTSCYLKRIHGMSHKDTLQLANLCGVNILPFEQNIDLQGQISDNSLKEFYLERLPFIMIEESKKLNENHSITLDRLYKNICSISLYNCQHIYVKYPFGDAEVEHYFDGNTLYVTDKWSCFTNKSRVHNHIKKQLGFKTNIEILIEMDPTSEKDKEIWFRSQKGDPVKLTEKLNLIKKEIKMLSSKSDINKSNLLNSNANFGTTQNDDFNLFKPKEDGDELNFKSCVIDDKIHDDTSKLIKTGENEILNESSKPIVKTEGEIKDNSLKEFYLERLVLIVIQESKQLNKEPSATLKRLYEAICSIKLYQCNVISVQFFPSSDANEVDHYFNKFTFYVDGNWKKWYRSQINDHIKEELCLMTNISGILDIDPITQMDKFRWLERQKEDKENYNILEKELQGLLTSKPEQWMAENSPHIVNEKTHKTSNLASNTDINIDTNFLDKDLRIRVQEIDNTEEIEDAVKDKNSKRNQAFVSQIQNVAFSETINSSSFRDANKRNLFPKPEIDGTLASFETVREDIENVQNFHQPKRGSSEESGLTSKFVVKTENNKLHMFAKNAESATCYSTDNSFTNKDVDIKVLMSGTFEVNSVLHSEKAKFYFHQPQIKKIHHKSPYTKQTFNVKGYKSVSANESNNIECNIMVSDARNICQQFQRNQSPWPTISCNISIANTRWLVSGKLEIDFPTSLNNKGDQNYFRKIKRSILRHEMTENFSNLNPHKSSVCYVQNKNCSKPQFLLQAVCPIIGCTTSEQKEISYYITNDSVIKDTDDSILNEENSFELMRKNKFSCKIHVNDVTSELCLALQTVRRATSSQIYEENSNAREHLSSYEKIVSSVGKDAKMETISQISCAKPKRIKYFISEKYYSSGECSYAGSVEISGKTNEDKEYIKWLSEMYVFEFLQNHYKNKYINSRCNLVNGIFTLKWKFGKLNIVWLNENGEKGHSCDFLLKVNDKIKKLIEVKITNLAESNSFINHSEFIDEMNWVTDEFPESKAKYCIYHIFVNSDEEIYQTISCPLTLYKITLQQQKHQT